MINQNDSGSELSHLRQQAEKQLKPTEPIFPLSETETKKLLHELQVQQIELEMQNQELQLAISAAEDAINLYDFAPVGYYTLSRTGEIIRLNFDGAQKLGKDRSDLINSNFKFFISRDYLPVFNEFISQVFQSNVKEFCEVILSVDGNKPLYVQLNGIATKSGEQCLLTAIDITERQQSDNNLKESEEKYRFMFANNPQPMWIFDVETLAFLEVNQAAVIHYGYSEEEFLTMTLKDIRPQEDIPKLLKSIESSNLEYNEPGEFRHRKKNGEIIDVQITRHAVTFNGRKARHVLINDITERKRAEEAQLQSQLFLNSIIENSPNMLWISDENGTLLRMNQACRDHLQIQDKEVVGIYNILKDNLLEEMGLMPLVKDVFEKGATVRFETSYDTGVIRIVNLEKTTRIFLDVNISPILNLEGKVTNAIIQEIDITERKQAEKALLKSKQQYDDLVSKIPVGVYILRSKPDGEFALDYTSPRMAEMLCLSVDSLLADKEAIFKAIHPDDLDGFRNLSREGIFLHRPFNWKGRIVADGNVKWMHFRSTPEPLENGDMLWHGLIVDITERVKAEQEISLKNEELSNLVAEKDRFFSILAHDLRSPFNVLLGLTQFLDEDLPDMKLDDAHKMVNTLRSTALTVYNLLENLLEWSRITRGNICFDPKLFLLQDKMDEFLQPVLVLANKKKIEISYSVPDELVVFADQNMLASIIRNLASNAIKFTPQNGKVILSAQATEDLNIEISVKDSGIGMNKGILDKLFNIDRKKNRKGTDGEYSSGLGLIICKELVEKHSGNIRVKSQVGKGSTFYLTLPQYVKV